MRPQARRGPRQELAGPELASRERSCLAWLALCKDTPRLKAKDFASLKRCRCFCIFVWNSEKAKAWVYFAFVRIDTERSAEQPLFFLHKGDCTVVLESGTHRCSWCPSRSEVGSASGVRLSLNRGSCCCFRPVHKDCGHYTQLPEFTHVCFRDVCHQLPAASTVVDPRQRQGGTPAGAPRLPPTPGAHTGPALGPAGLPGPLPRPCGPAGGDFCSAAPVPTGTSVFTRSRFRRRCEVFQEATFLPANSPALLDSEDLREGWGTTPESDQLLHFASNGQLCTGTKPQPHLSMVTRLFFGSSN